VIAKKKNVQFNYLPSDMEWGDMFCGGGGTTEGAMRVSDVKVSWAINHDDKSIETHRKNHPETVHFKEDIVSLNVNRLMPVDALWASLECTNFSLAKGAGSKDIKSRLLAWELPRYIRRCDPDMIYIENVKPFLDWGPLRFHPGKEHEDRTDLALDKAGNYLLTEVMNRKGECFNDWKNYIMNMGYPNCEYRMINVADHGGYTSRVRLFVIFTKKDVPIIFPNQTHSKSGLDGLKKWKACREKINTGRYGNSIFNRKKPYVPNTLRRIAGGFLKSSSELQYIVKYYGSGINKSSLNDPLHTIRTKDCHSLCTFETNQFLSDTVWGPLIDSLDTPLRTQMTRQTKRLHTYEAIDIHQLISTQNSSNGKPESQTASLANPLGVITCANKHSIVTMINNGDVKASQFTKERMEFASLLISLSHGKEKSQSTSLIYLICALIKDVYARFLDTSELAAITEFPRGYFDGVGVKDSIKMIGNAVPPRAARILVEDALTAWKEYKEVSCGS